MIGWCALLLLLLDFTRQNETGMLDPEQHSGRISEPDPERAGQRCDAATHQGQSLRQHNCAGSLLKIFSRLGRSEGREAGERVGIERQMKEPSDHFFKNLTV